MDTNTSGTGGTSNTHVTTPQALATPKVVTLPPTVVPVGKARVAISFLLQETDANLIVSSLRIVIGMTGNPAFLSPHPTLAEITAARNSFIAAVNAAKDSRLAIAVRNQQRAGFTGLLRNLAHDVQVASGGDLPTLLSSGFPAQRGRKQPIGPLPAPANLRLTRGSNSGQIIARCQKLKQAGAYEWRYATAANPAAWVEVDSTFAASLTITGLVPGTQYSVQVRALGTAGPSDWSGAVMLMVV